MPDGVCNESQVIVLVVSKGSVPPVAVFSSVFKPLARFWTRSAGGVLPTFWRSLRKQGVRGQWRGR
eukprot:4611662-Lingulodinium_polyedra.AAC.1